MDKPKIVPNLGPDGLLWMKEMSIESDVMGSYTGRTKNPYEIPIQDADDL